MLGGGSKKYIEVILRAQDKTGRVMEGFNGRLGMLKLGHLAVAGAAVKMGYEIAQAFIHATAEAAQFEAKMAEVRTLTNASASDHAELSKEVRELAVRFGQLDDVMSTASYNVVSAGYAGIADQVAILETAAKAAIAGVTDVNTAAKAITQTLNAYGMGAERAEHVSNVLFTTVKGGITTFPELAANLGKVNATAAVAGVRFEEVAAAMAIMTKGGIDTAEAATALNALIVALSAATPDAKAKLDDLGISLKDGLGPALAALSEAGGRGIDVLKELVPNTRALKGAASAGRDGAKEFNEQLERSEQSAGAANTAFGIMDKTAKQAEARFNSAKQAMQGTLGEAGLEARAEWFNKLTDVVGELAKMIEDKKDAIAGLATMVVRIGEAAADTALMIATLIDRIATLAGLDNESIRRKNEEAAQRYQREAEEYRRRHDRLPPEVVQTSPEYTAFLDMPPEDYFRNLAEGLSQGMEARYQMREQAKKEREEQERITAAQKEMADIAERLKGVPTTPWETVENVIGPEGSPVREHRRSEAWYKEVEPPKLDEEQSWWQELGLDEDTADMFVENAERMNEESLKAWEDAHGKKMDLIRAEREAWADAMDAIADNIGYGMADIAATGISTMVGLREGAVDFGDALKNLVATALEEVIRKLIVIKVLKSAIGGGLWGSGGTIPDWFAGGTIPHAAAGFAVPDGPRGLDSRLIAAMPGEEVIHRHLSQRLDRWLSLQESAAALMPTAGGGGRQGGVTVPLVIGRPVRRSDIVDMARTAYEAEQEIRRNRL